MNVLRTTIIKEVVSPVGSHAQKNSINPFSITDYVKEF